MRKLAPLFLVLLTLVGCDDSSNAEKSQPPPEMVGAWNESVPQLATGGPGVVQDVCSGFSVDAGKVSSNLFKIDEFGNVMDGKNVTNSNQVYRIIGTIDANGNVALNADGRQEFLGTFGAVTGVSLTPIVHALYAVDPIKGQTLSLDIQLQVVSGGQTATQPWAKREYYRLTDVTEKLMITKTQQCLAKAKGSNP